jgi:hypothetical protein
MKKHLRSLCFRTAVNTKENVESAGCIVLPPKFWIFKLQLWWFPQQIWRLSRKIDCICGYIRAMCSLMQLVYNKKIRTLLRNTLLLTYRFCLPQICRAYSKFRSYCCHILIINLLVQTIFNTKHVGMLLVFLCTEFNKPKAVGILSSPTNRKLTWIFIGRQVLHYTEYCLNRSCILFEYWLPKATLRFCNK